VILELDIGNTRLKWRHKSSTGSEVVAEGVCEDVETFRSDQSQVKPSQFRFCSVRDQAVTDELLSWSRTRWALTPEVAQVSRECAGVKINYSDVSSLGVDRWLAMLEAYRRAGGPCIIVDSGTAFTLDVIAADGEHKGGFILPGLSMMQDSLTSNTGIRLSAGAKHESTKLGNSTDEAVLNGSLASLVALIDKQVAELAADSANFKLYFSGGDAELLAEMTDLTDSDIVAGLVLDGLALACSS
jgi:type III pantothenate kinase